MAMMRTRTKSRGMCLCLLGIALALLVQPSTDFARGVPGLKEHAKRHPLHAGVARRAGAAQEDNSGQAWMAMAVMRARIKSQGACLSLGMRWRCSLQRPSMESLSAAHEFSRGVPGRKDRNGAPASSQRWLHAGVALRARAAREDNNAEDRLDLEEAIAEAERVLQDNDTVEKIKAVLRKAQKINPGKWTLSGKKDELKQKLREFVEEAKATLKGLKEDSRGPQVTRWHPGRGGVASRASPQQDSGAEDWLAKSREEVEAFGEEEVLSWAEAVLNEGKVRDELIQRTVTTLQQQGVTGKSLLELTLEKLMAAPYNIPGGPAELLTKKIQLLKAPQVTEQVVTAKDFNIAACLRPSDGDRPKRFLELDSCVDDCMQAVQDNLPLVTKSTKPRVPPAMLSRCMRGGKTTMLCKVFDRLKKEEKLPIFISFNGDSLVSKLDGEKVLDTMLRAIAVSLMKNKPADKKDAQRVRCSEKALKAYLADKQDVVLVVDELNVLLKANPTDGHQDVGRFLREMFLDPAGRHLVFSTHIPTSAGLDQVLGKGEGSSRTAIPIKMPRCAEVQRLRGMHPNCAALTPLEAVCFGYIPSLIYSVKTGDLDLKERFREIIPAAESELPILAKSFLSESFLSEFFTGERGPDHDPVRAFDALTESPKRGQIRWILAYVGQMCCYLGWKQVGAWIEELPSWSGKVESGQDWETVLLVALCLRCYEAKYSEPHELLGLAKGALRPAAVYVEKVPQENSTNPEVILAWWKGQPIDTYPYIAVLSPTFSKTEIVDAMWVYQKDATASCLVRGMQAKLGSAYPKQDMPLGMLGLLFRGQAPDTTRNLERQRWKYLTASEIQSFLGKSLTAACPAHWPNVTP
ncbi:unnamed protein product [Effrenium voratum]|nr:unnamed protein product [Effrenium voratum]